MIALLCTRVKDPNESDWNKLIRLMKFLNTSEYICQHNLVRIQQIWSFKSDKIQASIPPSVAVPLQVTIGK